MPLLKEGQRVSVTFRGKKCCGFVTVIPKKPISRYVVTVITPPFEFDTVEAFTDAMVRNLFHPNGPSVWDYVYKRRDELEASVFGAPVAQESAVIQ